MFVSSVVLVLAVTSLPSDGTVLWGYALTVGVIGGAASLAGALLVENPAGQQPLMPTALGPISANSLLIACLLIWWGVGAGVLTIHGPFLMTTNGYFACAGTCTMHVCHARALYACVRHMSEAHTGLVDRLYASPENALLR